MWSKKTEGNITWKLAPFLRLLLPLIAGFLIEYHFPSFGGLLITIFCVSFTLFIICNIISSPGFFGIEWIFGLVIQLTFFSLGRLLLYEHQDKQLKDSSCFNKNQSYSLMIRVLSDPVRKQNSYCCLARISWLIKDQTCYFENEKVLLYLNKKSDLLQISVGTLIITRKTIQPIENYNVFDFDY